MSPFSAESILHDPSKSKKIIWQSFHFWKSLTSPLQPATSAEKQEIPTTRKKGHQFVRTWPHCCPDPSFSHLGLILHCVPHPPLTFAYPCNSIWTQLGTSAKKKRVAGSKKSDLLHVPSLGAKKTRRRLHQMKDGDFIVRFLGQVPPSPSFERWSRRTPRSASNWIRSGAHSRGRKLSCMQVCRCTKLCMQCCRGILGLAHLEHIFWRNWFWTFGHHCTRRSVHPDGEDAM